MRERRPGEGRDFRADIDDMGDDEQEEEIALTEQYVEDPPEDHVIEEPEESRDGVGIGDYERQSARRGEDERWPDPNVPAERDAVNPTRRP
ncbi:hypothetical protein LUW76_39960 [Actinomadura madurae]|uniref:hypothetical protein n=1 Tax=Actinomadura madurae TaxID=1993 RepID=UPI002026A7E7|nr:hypothetical protein [Actinomadura madurae]URN00003.1 hypothetical protein LUW76_39960 [Actinomadura madurae]URN02169.1 hypothetical protein LUW74_01385 [Actinomadura madurae]